MFWTSAVTVAPEIASTDYDVGLVGPPDDDALEGALPGVEVDEVGQRLLGNAHQQDRLAVVDDRAPVMMPSGSRPTSVTNGLPE